MNHATDLELYSCPDCGSVMNACAAHCHDNRTGGDEGLYSALSEVADG